MCVTNYWKGLTANDSGNIFALRSDNLLFKFFEEEFNNIPDFVEKLSEFRDCKCSSSAPCSKHSEEKERISNARS